MCGWERIEVKFLELDICKKVTDYRGVIPW